MDNLTSADVVLEEVKITLNLEYISLNKNHKEWCSQIVKSFISEHCRKNTYFINKQYTINEVVVGLIEIYMKNI